MAKIAILYETLGRSKGGIETWIFSASEEVVNQGHQVTLFYVNDSDLSDAAPINVSFVKLKPHFRLKTLDFYSQIWSLYFQLKDKLSPFDIVWARSFTMVWAAAAILGKGKVVYINAAPFSFYGQTPFNEKYKKSKKIRDYVRAISSELSVRIAYSLEKRAIQKSKNVFLSNARKLETLKFFNLDVDCSNYFVVPAGVNTKRFFPNTANVYIGGDLKILTVCRLAPDKNVQCVIKAVRELCNMNIPSTLTIVGEGNYESELKELVSDLGIDHLVSFVGRQENVELWYREHHVFVLPSLYEGFGSVYVEAMASGLPCIAISNKSGRFSVAADEIIEHGLNGFLMTDDKVIELRDLLLRYQSNREQLTEMGIKAVETVEKCFKWKNTVDKLLSISI